MKKLNQYILEKFKISKNTTSSTLNGEYYLIPWSNSYFIDEKYLVGITKDGDVIFLLNTKELYEEFIKEFKSIDKIFDAIYCYELKNISDEMIHKIKSRDINKKFNFKKYGITNEDKRYVKYILSDYIKML